MRVGGVWRGIGTLMIAFCASGALAQTPPSPATANPGPAQAESGPASTPPAAPDAAPNAPPAPPAPAPADSAPADPAPSQSQPGAPAPASPASPPQGTPGGASDTAAPPPAGAQHPDMITGEVTVLNPAPVLVKGASSSWEDGYDTIVATLDAINTEMNRLGLRKAGEPLVMYTSSDDAGFEFEAQVPFAGDTTERPGNGVKIGASYSGRVMKFHHSGSFADMDTTYEAIANYLDARNAESQDFYIERYATDPATASPEALEVDIFVPLR